MFVSWCVCVHAGPGHLLLCWLWAVPERGVQCCQGLGRRRGAPGTASGLQLISFCGLQVSRGNQLRPAMAQSNRHIAPSGWCAPAGTVGCCGNWVFPGGTSGDPMVPSMTPVWHGVSASCMFVQCAVCKAVSIGTAIYWEVSGGLWRLIPVVIHMKVHYAAVWASALPHHSWET